jgi:hypothetical protein
MMELRPAVEFKNPKKGKKKERKGEKGEKGGREKERKRPTSNFASCCRAKTVLFAPSCIGALI